jgi:hypothetical protein
MLFVKLGTIGIGSTLFSSGVRPCCANKLVTRRLCRIKVFVMCHHARLELTRCDVITNIVYRHTLDPINTRPKLLHAKQIRGVLLQNSRLQ